jgi:hypothetical protein
MTAKWQPAYTYVPGSRVTPRTTTATQNSTLTNPDFEDGLTGWTSDGSSWSAVTDSPYSGTKCAQYLSDGGGALLNDAWIDVTPGDSITASAKYKPIHSSDSGNEGHIGVYFFTADKQYIGATGNVAGSWYGSPGQKGGSYRDIHISISVPPSAKFAKIALWGSRYDGAGTGYFDAVALTVSRTHIVTPGLVFRATQAAPGKSGTSEPTWPDIVGVEVTDNEVTWEGVIATRLTWEAVPLLKSGGTEPTWPTENGGVVHDGSIDWVAASAQITDPKCPNSKVVAIMASKIFAADRDIVRFSATVNPLDWSSKQDAGYLPTGLQQSNSNDMAVLAPYRSNLTAFNASSFQNWQVDPDPAAMALLDQMEGIGSTYQHAAQPVGNDLLYLSQLGVRSVTVAAGADSLKAGDVGMPVDALVQPAMKADATTLGPRATYYPSAGQYWLACAPTGGDPVVFVLTLNGGKGKWSRYAFPFSVDAFAQLGNDLYIRHGDEVSIVSKDVATDDKDGNSIDFGGVVQWHWLNCGKAGVTKMLESVDYVGSGQGPSISIGYDQRNPEAFTEPYLIDPDTLPGDPIPLPVAAPTFSVRLDFAGGEAWSVNALTLHLDDMGGQP